MYHFISNHKRLIQVVLAIVFLPFAFFGVDSYFRSSDASVGVATVGGYRISQGEFNRALRDRQEAIQRMAGGRADPALLDSAELRFNVLDALIRERLLLQRGAGMTVSERQLQTVIGELPLFQENGKFSFQIYERFLKSQGMTPAMFEANLTRDLILQQLNDAYGGTVFVSRAVVDRLARLSEQQREVSFVTIAPEKFLSQIKLEPDAARKYFDSHQDEFRIPEQVRVEYVVLTADSLLAQIPVDAAEVRKYYDEHHAQYEVREERQASHILIGADATASAEVKQKARAQADEIAKQLKQHPDRFAELAKQYSQDPGSAAKGGDLGYFGRGTMVKSFDDAVFRMKVGEISAPVESQYGFHIIRLTGVRGGQSSSFEEVRGQIEAELKKQRAGRKFAEIAENFNNIVFEQAESLKPAAELAKTSPQKSGWIMRERADAPLNNPKLLQAIFSDEVLKNKRNTEAVEVAPGVLVAARVIEHKPAAVQPFDEVSGAIVKKITLQQAGQLAAQEGRAQIEKLRQGQDAQAAWGPPQLVGRADAKGLSEAMLVQAFRANTAKLPAYAGVDDPRGGYTLIRVTRVVEVEKIAPDRQKALAEGLRQMLGQEEMLAYIASLKQKAEIKVSKDLLEKK
jgi:peptidyl-prolyl cis-trans isomerase D